MTSANWTEKIYFYKMHGCGNDFVLIDNRALSVPVSQMEKWAVALCNRTLGIGSDGLIFLESAKAPGLDYAWHFYNADASRAEMCGNASRCAARLALELGLAGPKQVFGTDAGPIKAEVDTDTDLVTVQLTAPKDLRLDLEAPLPGRVLTVHFVNTGVPHAVVILDQVAELDVAGLGAAIRYHDRFAPAGTNVDFVRIVDKNNMIMRTYERGVEGETQACGTGAAASALIGRALGLTGETVSVRTSGGQILGIAIKGDEVFLTGPAVKVFQGELYLAAVGLNK